MLTSSASSSSLASNKGTKNGSGSKRDKVHKNESEDDEDVPAAHLTRPTPDAILADEADPDTLLGDESDSDTGNATKRMARANSSGKRSKLEGNSKGKADGNVAGALEPASSKRDYRRSRQLFDASDVAGAMEGGRLAQANGHGDDADDEKVKELQTQLTGLNNKLVVSFERIGDLEDNLSQAHEGLAAAKIKIETLEKERGEHLAALNTGLLVEKEHVSTEMQKMMERLVQETAEKGKAVDERAKIEAELDDLSSSLFAEANKMVAVEKLARARAEEKSRSMEERLKDTEEIMEQQQKRLVQLQGALEDAEAKASSQDEELLQGEQGRERRIPRISMGPAQNALASGMHLDQLTPLAGGHLRLDVVPYIELRTFLNHLRKLRLQLAPFYSYAGLQPFDDSASQPSTPTFPRQGSPAPTQAAFGGAVTASPFAAADVPRHKDFPSLPANVEQLVHLPSQVSSLGFLKRINEEDAEPCLRLDFAPGLNWLSRRQMQTAILEGNLMIEPIFGGGRYDEKEVRTKAAGSAPAACALCGKIVVNVPLPGGGVASDVSGWASAASSLQASVGGFASSLPGREATASPPLGAGLFSSSSTTSSTGSKDTATPTVRNKTSIFGTLRSISGSGRSFSGSNTGNESAAQQQQASLIASITQNHPEDPWAGRLAPIPTHIFRISESSSARYLLCPDFCLRRLRATCDLWGYIRALERAVVLEGKFAFDNDQQQAQRPRQSRSSTSATIAPVVEQATGDEKEPKEAEPVEGKADSEQENAAEEDDGQGSAAETDQEKSDGHKDAADDEDAMASNVSNSDTESMHSAADEEDDAGSHDDGDHGGPDDKTLVRADQDIAHIGEDTGKESKNTETTANAKSIDSTSEKPNVPSKEPPKLPPRNLVVPSPSVPGTAVSQSHAELPPLPPRDLGPEPRRSLDTADPDNPSWEEKVWLEVNRLRADLWAARIGVMHPDLAS